MISSLRELYSVLTTNRQRVTAFLANHQLLFVLLFICVALLSHFLFLSNRPIHFDESINGWFVLQMREWGYYKYDPSNYHGPLYFYLLEFTTRLFGHDIAVVRTLPILFSLASVLFFWRRSKWTAILLALSPSTIYYARYGIHESTFVLFQIFFFVGLYEYQQRQRLLSIYLALVGLAGMMCLKETFVLTGFATVVAILFFFPWKKFVRDLVFHMKLPIAYFLFVVIMFFTGGGQSARGIGDFFRAFGLWFQTGVHDNGHDKAFHYWLEFVWQTEPLLLLAMLMALAGLAKKQYRSLSLFALTLWLIYSLTPYKTPWCILSWTWPFYFLMGQILSHWWTSSNGKRAYLGFTLVVILFLTGWARSWGAIYPTRIAMEHPFVYVNTSYEFKAVDDAIKKALRENEALRQEVIQISIEEPWPLPWTLQDSRGLHYDKLKDKIFPRALVYFSDVDSVHLLEKEVAEAYVSQTILFRAYGRPVRVFLRSDIFTEFPQ